MAPCTGNSSVGSGKTIPRLRQTQRNACPAFVMSVKAPTGQRMDVSGTTNLVPVLLDTSLGSGWEGLIEKTESALGLPQIGTWQAVMPEG
jgi:hypothetical protein